MLVVISPAKKMADLAKLVIATATNKASTSTTISKEANEVIALSKPLLFSQTRILLKQLKQYSLKELAQLMKISEKLIELNAQRYKDFSLHWSKTKTYPAGFLFHGDTHAALDIPSLSSASLAYARDNLRILSGLYGVLSPFDGIEPYRLEMGTRLAVAKSKNLYEFWQNAVTAKINDDLKDHHYLLNCASQEYAAVLDRKALRKPMITAVFKEDRKGKSSGKDRELKTIGLFAKKARGHLARYVIQQQIQDCEDLKSYKGLGYRYHAALSSEDSYVFVRKS